MLKKGVDYLPKRIGVHVRRDSRFSATVAS